MVVDDEAGLLSLAKVGALEVHAWGSRTETFERPDRLIFDLDPDPKISWKEVVNAARPVREFLQQLGLESFVKTTGGKGLHLRAHRPQAELGPGQDILQTLADAVVTADTNHYASNMAKTARPGKIFIDYLRNARGATAVVPFSPRARENAPVSAPLTWENLVLQCVPIITPWPI